MRYCQRMSDENRMSLEYPPDLRVRPPNAAVARIIKNDRRYQAAIKSFLFFVPQLSAIKPEADSSAAPCWKNDWFVGLDAVSLYGFLATRKPARYIEIGSGMSTKFARQAIKDHALPTKIVSIDPDPRSEIDAICDQVVRAKLEDIPLSFFASLRSDDMLFFDGSHRSFQGSDVTVFFTEILPTLRRGMLVGIHDIYLPNDYPSAWRERLYNEQYLLTCWLLGNKLRIELPVFYCSFNDVLHGILKPLWDHPHLDGAIKGGGAFWLRL